MERDSKWLCHILTTTLVLKKFLFFLFFFSFLRKILTRRETYSHMYALNVFKKNVSLSPHSPSRLQIQKRILSAIFENEFDDERHDGVICPVTFAAQTRARGDNGQFNARSRMLMDANGLITPWRLVRSALTCMRTLFE